MKIDESLYRISAKFVHKSFCRVKCACSFLVICLWSFITWVTEKYNYPTMVNENLPYRFFIKKECSTL